MSLSVEFKAVLSATEVHQKVTDYLIKKKCYTIKMFSNWVDDKPEWNAVMKDTDLKDDPDLRLETAKVKQAWRDAEG